MAPGVTVAMDMKQAAMEEAAQVNKKYTVTLTARFPSGSLMAVRGSELAVGCQLWPAAGWPAQPLPRPSSKAFVRNEPGLAGQAGGKSRPPKRESGPPCRLCGAPVPVPQQ